MAPSGKVQRNLVLLMVLLSAASYFDRTILSIAAPGMMKEFGISETQMGTVFSAFLLSYSLMMTPGGGLADRFGPRLVLGLTGMGTALFTGMVALCGRGGLFGLAGALPALIAVRLLFGICAAPLYPACGRLTANWIPASRAGRVQGIIMSAAPLGSAISPVLFAFMIARFGWRPSFWMAAAATAVVFAIWLVYVRDYPPGAEHGGTRRVRHQVDWRALLRNRKLVALTLSYVTINYFEYIFYYWIYYYFGEIRHMGKSQSAIYVTILMLVPVVTTPVGGWLSDRLVERHGRHTGRRIIPMAGLTASAVLLIVGASGLGTIATVTLLSLAVGLVTSTEGSYWASAIDFGEGDAGAACGIMNTGGNVGGFFAPILTPLIASRMGWNWALYAAGIVALFGVTAWFGIKPALRAGEDRGLGAGERGCEAGASAPAGPAT